MEGHAWAGTFDFMARDPVTAPILKEMRNADGTPHVCEKVWISYSYGDTEGEAVTLRAKVLAEIRKLRNPNATTDPAK
jgi:hypothetical protein